MSWVLAKFLKIATIVVLSGLLATVQAQPEKKAEVIQTNAAHIFNAPKWLKRNRAERVIRRIETELEWSIRRIEVHWHNNNQSFTAKHNLGPAVRAVTMSSDQTVHLGPQVNEDNFNQIFAHELVHVISFQKFKGSIPKWLEEGLANHLARNRRVDYQWLDKQKLPPDIYQMTHAFEGGIEAARIHYAASQALAEMLSRKCDLMRLVHISLEGDMKVKIQTFCEIPDLNRAFRDWVSSQAKRKATV